MRAALYTRVSTSQQVDGISLQLQEERLRSYATAMGWEIVEIYVDAGLSGASKDRPEYQRMLADVKERRFDVILVYKLDRLTRSVRDFHELTSLLDSYGVGLVSVTQNIDTSSPTGRLLRNVLVDFANFERELIAERSTEAKRRKASDGKYLGWKPPYGYRKEGSRSDSRLVIVPEEADIVRRIYQLYLTGQHGIIPIAREVGLSASTVREILLNPTYCGKIAYAKRPGSSKRLRVSSMDDWIVVDGEHEPIISEEEWQRAQLIREQNFLKRGPSRGSPHLFSRMVYCARCGNLCRLASSKRTHNGRTYRHMYYRCDLREDSRKNCSQPPVRHNAIEAAFVKALGQIMKDDKLWEEVSRRIKDEEDCETKMRLKALNSRREQITRRIDNLVAHLADGAIATAIRPRLIALEEERKAVDEEIRQLQRQLEAAEQQRPDLTREILQDVSRHWKDMTVEEKREGVRLLVRKFDIDGYTVTIHWTDRYLEPLTLDMPGRYEQIEV